MFAFPRSIRFYENGVAYSPVSQGRLQRFVFWTQLERYQFEGDLMILTGTDSTLKGGPVAGTVFHLRPGARSLVAPILAQHLPMKSSAA